MLRCAGKAGPSPVDGSSPFAPLNELTGPSAMTTLKSLLARRADLDSEIEHARQQQRSAVMSQILELMKLHGITSADIATASAGKGKRLGTVPPKYRHPESGQTWSGRGLQPRWLAEAVAAGNSLDQYRIVSL